MATISIRSQIKLLEPIVLATPLTTQGDVSYPPISWKLANGDTVSLTLDIPEIDINEHRKHILQDGWIVNLHIETVSVLLKILDVADDDLDRLYGKHISAQSFVVYDDKTRQHQTHQEAPELGKRINREIREAVNRILRLLRDNFGQYWLRLLTDDAPPQTFLQAVQVEWCEGTSPWMRLYTGPQVLQGGTIWVGVEDNFLEINDWREVQEAITRDEYSPDGLALLSDAKERYDQGDKQIAIIHLNSALEWAVQHFLQSQLGTKIPSDSLRTLLNQSYGRLLNEWVLPLARDAGLNLESNEWPSIKCIQRFRAEAGHPFLSRGLEYLTGQKFRKLVRDATSAVTKMAGLRMPKIPPGVVGHFSAGGTYDKRQ